MGTALAVEADLRLTVEGHPVEISGSGTHLTVATSSLRGAIAVLRSLGTLSELVEPVGTRFVAADLSADVEVRGIVIARIGPHVEPNALSRALGVAPARVWPGAVLRSLGRELRA
ncbi:hypothetical protein HAPAU_21930 [Halalkalicoccus paucihalophilus]|uniref:Uncharacterized protein n=1 Tax=Halalkalicoccus paucihalophilus TaxID=1008153 RepID=A0A151AD17_9EURY|nr:hypothetical protein [Halalkalicoccus paucihalophilus]KYH25519.1 hypothetical protein HAPAU_21930 [Halalkalicoccus paucihalophilus]